MPVNPLDISPLTRVVTRVDRLRDGEVDASIIPTGFPSLDRAIGGGFHRGDLIVLGGDDGVGCSSLALAIALRIRERTLLLTSEMRPERAYERALAMTARVTLDALRLGAVEDRERAQLAAAAVALRDRAPVIDVWGESGLAAVRQAADSAPAGDALQRAKNHYMAGNALFKLGNYTVPVYAKGMWNPQSNESYFQIGAEIIRF